MSKQLSELPERSPRETLEQESGERHAPCRACNSKKQDLSFWILTKPVSFKGRQKIYKDAKISLETMRPQGKRHFSESDLIHSFIQLLGAIEMQKSW